MREIRVIYDDDSTGLVTANRLDVLISSGKIKSFLRSDGWVRIGLDPIRRFKVQGRERWKAFHDPKHRLEA